MSTKGYLISAAGLLFGCVFYNLFNFNSIFILFLIASSTFSFLSINQRKISCVKAIALFLIFFSLGSIRYTVDIKAINSLKLPNEKEFYLTGKVSSQPKNKEEKCSFFLKSSSINKDNCSAYFWVSTRKKLDINFGDKIGIKACAVKPHSGSFKKYLLRKRVSRVLYINEVITIEETYLSSIGRLRDRISSFYENKGGESLLLASLIADKSKLSEEDKSNMKTSGLAHIWAVSGLHVGCLMIFIIILVRLCGFKPLNQVISVSSFLVGYSLLTGLNPPVIRASIMGFTVLIAWYLGRKRDLFSCLLFTLIIMVLYDPFLIYEPGFQLSFSAVFGIFFLAKKFENLFWDWPNLIKKSVSVSFSAFLTTTPVLMINFGTVPLYSVIANVLAVPLVMPMMVFNFLYCILFWFPGSTILKSTAAVFASSILKIATLVSNLPFSRLYLDKNLVIIAVLLAISLVFVLMKKLKVSFATILIIVVAIITTGCFVQTTQKPSNAELTFFDVGQGDATLIQDKDKSILIDGGPEYDSVADKLSSKGITKLDVVILTHPHADHLSGLLKVVRKFKIGIFIGSSYPHTSYGYRDLLKEIKNRKIKYLKAEAGKKLKLGRIKIDILSPSSKLLSGTEDDNNNSSIVCKIYVNDISALFTGDASKDVEKVILKEKTDINSQILKVSHHGSNDASSTSFLRYVNGEIAIISVGKENQYGHPASLTLKKLKNAGYSIYRTDEDGTITISTKNEKLVIKRENE